MMVDFVPDPALYPFQSRWFESSAGQVHYIDEGAGPPILLCHGSPTWSFLYRHIVTDCASGIGASQWTTQASDYRSAPPVSVPPSRS